MAQIDGMQDLILQSQELVPRVWQKTTAPTGWRVFNPAVFCWRGRWLLLYRVQSADWFDRTAARRLALCELEPETWRVKPETVAPLSDWLPTDGGNCGDARFIEWQDRLFIYYPNDPCTRPNRQFLIELDADTLEPRDVARSLVLEGPRRMVDKNWGLFVHDGELFAVYNIAPHVVLRLEAGASEIVCRRVYETAWNATGYQARYGELRGGAPPVRVGDVYYSFFHSAYLPNRVGRKGRALTAKLSESYAWQDAQGRVTMAGRWFRRLRVPQMVTAYRHRWERWRYVGGCYSFAARPPFAPIGFTPQPTFDEPPPVSKDLLPAGYESIMFPVGAVCDAGRWVVSYGVHNAHCVLRIDQGLSVPPNVL